MKAIWKFGVASHGEFQLLMPKGASILHVAVQPDANQHLAPVLWALVDPGQPTELRTFRVLFTGEQWEDPELAEAGYVGSYQRPPQTLGGQLLVGHLFELPK